MISADHAPIDWDDAKSRIKKLGKSLMQSEMYSAEDAEAVLYLRAQLLAQVVEQPDDEGDGVEAIILSLSSERYAIETSIIREVIRPTHIASLPGTATLIIGMMNLRGRPLLIVDGRKLLELTNTELSDSARVVIVGTDEAEFGILIEATEEVRMIDVSKLLETPKSVPETARKLVRGITSDAIVLLDSANLISDPRIWIDE